MAITISAVFDSEDMADLARSRLRSSGIEYGDCSVEPLNAGAPAYTNSLDVLVGPFVPFAGLGITETFAMLPANAQMYGGVLMTRGESDVTGIERDIGADGTRSETHGEVKMKLRVRNDQVSLAESVLTSCHGTRVRRG